MVLSILFYKEDDDNVKWKTTISLELSTHKLLHRPMRDDGSLSSSHRRRQQSEADGFPNQEEHGARHRVCRKTRSLGSPSDKRGTQPSGNSHQTDDCVQRAVSPLSAAQSVPILGGKQELPPCPRDKGRERRSTSSYNSLVLAE